MARGMLRGAAAAWMGLIALQAFTQKNGADAVGGLIGTLDSFVQRALDPKVAAIPDHSKGDPAKLPDKTPVLGSDGKPNGGYFDGDGKYIPPTDANTPAPKTAPGKPGNPIPEAYIPWPSVPGTTSA